MNKEKLLRWVRAAGLRAMRTFAQALTATIGATMLLSDVNWAEALSAATLAAILSLLMSIGGLPEIEEN